MEWKDIAAVDEIPDGGMKRVDVSGREVAVARVGQNIYAFGDRCPHMNAPLHEGKIENGRVICPLPGHVRQGGVSPRFGDRSRDELRDQRLLLLRCLV